MKNMKVALSFDDVLLKPADFTDIKSRKDVETYSDFNGIYLDIPIVSSNMDTVYSPELAREVARNGGVSCVHRFCDIEKNIELFRKGFFILDQFEILKPWVSIGVGDKEKERAEALVDAEAEVVLIDLANGAQQQCVEQYDWLREKFGMNIKIVVGNFATANQINAFTFHSKTTLPDLIKVNIGSGSACKTRVVAGVGLPSVESILDCKRAGLPIMQDGGIKNSGDFAKAIALGCSCVMLGKLFAATYESAAPEENMEQYGYTYPSGYKIYRGSASLSSYKTQGKVATHRAAEGEEFLVKITGSVENLMQELEGGLRSSMTYLNAQNIEEFQENAEWVQITSAGWSESKPHGANND